VSPTVFIFGCVALCAAFVFAIVCAYKFGKYQGWREVVRTSTLYEKESMTLQTGETLVAVVEMKKGTYFFLSNHTRKGSNYE
jgi:hypothetical protein